MLLAIDIGNTSVACGLFRGGALVLRFRFPTARVSNARALERLLRVGAGRRPVGGVCIVSVVPRLDPLFRRACAKVFGVRPLFATLRTIGIRIQGYNKKQVGADRLVNAFAAYERYGRALVVVDVGTAVTFDVVDSKGRFIGGAIAPGMNLAAAALCWMTAKLPYVPPARQRRAAGRNTREAIRSGVYYGAVGAIDRIVREISRERRFRPLVIATGGHARLIAPASETIRRVHPDLTLEGLRLVWERNR